MNDIFTIYNGEGGYDNFLIPEGEQITKAQRAWLKAQLETMSGNIPVICNGSDGGNSIRMGTIVDTRGNSILKP